MQGQHRLSIKTGACPEDSKYCPQSSRHKTGLEAERLMQVEQVLESARKGQGEQLDPFLHGRGVEEPARARYALSAADGAGRESDGHGNPLTTLGTGWHSRLNG